MATEKAKENEPIHQLAGLTINSKAPAVPGFRPQQPARPTQPPEEESDVEEEDEDDPFADRNAVNTPAIEKPEPRW